MSKSCKRKILSGGISRRSLAATLAVAMLAALLTLSAPPAGADVIAGPIVNPANGHTYYVVDEAVWTDAEAEAVALGGHLATVNSQAENDWIVDTIFPLLPDLAEVWIGLNDAAVEGTFVWSSGEPVTYTNWWPGQPDNARGNEDYVHMWTFHAQANHWNDLANDWPEGVPRFGLVEVPTVEIDIKPGSDPNSVNCANPRGVIPVAIITTAVFDATTVDHTTVTFEGATETHVDKKTDEPRRHEADVDGDGDLDLVFHFRLGTTGLTCASTSAELTGATFSGYAVVGSDAIHMVGA